MRHWNNQTVDSTLISIRRFGCEELVWRKTLTLQAATCSQRKQPPRHDSPTR
jgi:hypothetical protein